MKASLALAVLALFSCSSAAEEAQVAVAANFAAPARLLAERFSRDTPDRISVSIGSTGKFYAQIRNGAPFDAFLAADDETPQRMEKEQLAVAGSRFTYALGKLVLWSAKPDLIDAKGQVLRSGVFSRIAIANPKLAPYGAAAVQAMEKLGVWPSLREKLVLGENVAQTLQFIASGNADLGFVALSQVSEGGRPPAGSHWRVPQALYEPIRQDAVLLARGSGNAAARAFLQYLRGAAAREVIRASGYDLP